MQTHTLKPALRSGEIHFPNGRRAKWVKHSPDADPREAISALGLARPRSLLLVVGGAELMDSSLAIRLQQFFNLGIAPAAMEAGALILDGGTQAGTMALMGQGVADRGHEEPLVGVAPLGLVTWPGGPAYAETEKRANLDPYHSHFVLVDSDTWGGETQTLFELAAELAGTAPIVVVLINGGRLSQQEVLRAVRRGWPVVVLESSGRLADELASLVRERPEVIEDPALAEIVAEGNLSFFPLDGSPHELGRLLAHELREDTVLKLAWQRFAWYDANANHQQRAFRRLYLWSIVLSCLATLVALSQTQLRTWDAFDKGTTPDRAFQVLVVALSAAITALAAAYSRFKTGAQWILLRTHAEALKREIFRYRCRTCAPGETSPSGRRTCERRLASRMKLLGQQLTRTEANLLALRSYQGSIPPPEVLAPDDDGLSALTPSRYIRYRLDNQLVYYHGKIDQLTLRAQRLQWAIILLGALGVVFGSVGRGLELWVALITTLVMAITAWLGLVQGDHRLMKYHQAATALDDLKAWWNALPLDGQARRRNFDALVDRTETVLQSELAGWEQEMKDVLAQLDARHEHPLDEGGDDKRRDASP